MWTRTSAVPSDDRISVLIIKRYDLYDLSLSTFVFPGFIEGNPISAGRTGHAWNGEMLVTGLLYAQPVT